MTSPVEQLIVMRFLEVYGEPAGNLPALVREYRKALDGTDAGLLEGAINLAIYQHEFANWPTVGECAKAVHTIGERRAVEAARHRKADPLDDLPAPSAEQRARVDRLLRDATAKLKDAQRKGPEIDWAAGQRPAWEARFGISG